MATRTPPFDPWAYNVAVALLSPGEPAHLGEEAASLAAAFQATFDQWRASRSKGGA